MGDEQAATDDEPKTDEKPKIIAPVGTHFSLQWTADSKAKIKNTFEIVKSPPKKGEHDEVTHVWPAPPKKGAPPQKPRPEVELKLQITWDGTPYGFRRTVPAPSARHVSLTTVQFTMIFLARDEGDYVFTVNLPNGTKLTKEVTVVAANEISEKRQLMLDTIALWMPSSTLAQRPPTFADPAEEAKWLEVIKSRCNWSENRIPGLMELSGWWNDPARLDKDGNPNPRLTSKQHGTSCGDVLAKMLALWGADFDDTFKIHKVTGKPMGSTRAFGIRDDLKEEKPPGSKKWVLVTGSRAQKGAITYGYYQDAAEAYAREEPILPEPGDVLVLRDGIDTQSLGHVNILVSASTDVWCTADGGGGVKKNDEQTAGVGDRIVKYTTPDEKFPHGRPIVVSVTDGKEKLVDGWVVLDRIPNVYFKPDGTRRTEEEMAAKIAADVYE